MPTNEAESRNAEARDRLSRALYKGWKYGTVLAAAVSVAIALLRPSPIEGSLFDTILAVPFGLWLYLWIIGVPTLLILLPVEAVLSPRSRPAHIVLAIVALLLYGVFVGARWSEVTLYLSERKEAVASFALGFAFVLIRWAAAETRES